ncbi:MAG: DUF2339 domain-containing protein [Proteobacteria bacterium]|nr:DUF2339 domain-containing protein [Pseudomonadota bacterium]
MKYIFAIIAGFFVGGFSHEGNGYIVGGIIGFLIMQLVDLRAKILNLEKQLKRKLSSSITVAEKDTELEEFDQSNIVGKGITDKETNSQNDIQNNIEPLEPIDVKASNINAHEKSVAASINNISQNTQQSDWELAQSLTKSEPAPAPKPTKITRPIKKVPNAIEKTLSKIKSLAIGYFTGGNSLVRAGMLVLFIGVAFLLKYVAERTVVPIEYRYIGIVFACLVMLVLGWKLRKKRPGFALSLEGGGIGLLYLTLFAALRLHDLLPAHIVLLLLIAIVFLSAILAILQDSMALAVIGIIGGFAAPVLTSTGSGSHVQLFSYYLLLNMGVFAIAWFKSWRILNVIGFVATFGIGSIWGYQFYKPDFLMSVEPFLIAYFLLYTFIAVLFALKQPPNLKGINDGTIIFGTPLVAFALQAALMKDIEYGLAYSALALGVFYVLLATVIKMMKKPYLRDLMESFVALGIGFATLAIPLGFDGRVTSAMWVAEGCALLWVGIRQSRMFPRFSGYALTLLGMLAFFAEQKSSLNLMPWLNADYVGTLIIVLSTAFIALYARKNASKLIAIEGLWIPSIMVVFSVIWWVYGGTLEIHSHYSTIKFMLLELFLALSSVALLLMAAKINFKLIKVLSVFVTLLMIVPFAVIPESIKASSAVFNIPFIGLLIYTITHFFMSWYWQTDKSLTAGSKSMQVSNLMLAIGLTAWVYTGHNEIYTYLSFEYSINLSLVFMSVSFVFWLLLAHRFNWQSMHLLSYAFLPYLMVMAYANLAQGHNFHAGYGLFVWLFSAIVSYWILRIADNADNKIQFKGGYHLGSLLLLVFIAVFEFNELIVHTLGANNIWQQTAACFMLLLISISLYSLRKINIWPFKPYKINYFVHGLAIISIALWLMIIALNLSVPKQASLISYMPLLNTIDIVGIVFVFFAWKVLTSNVLKLSSQTNKIMMLALPITAFFILNTSMLRSFHFWYLIDYKFNAMISSFLVQSAFSILWSLTAVILMVVSAKKHWRTVWLVGLGLMVAVVIKLFLVDMSASGTVERIVAFLSVGVLLSLVGYFSPLPPDSEKTI